MSGTITEMNHEVAVLDSHKAFLNANAHPALKPLNEAAIARFEKLGFPHSKHEMFTFVNTYDVANTAFTLKEGTLTSNEVEQNTYPACSKAKLVFVDGVFNAELSDSSGLPAGVSLTPLSEAVKQNDIRAHLEKTIAEENDAFACLNSAFMKNGLLIDLADNAVLESPVQVLYIGTGSDAPVTHHPRLIVRLGRTAEMKLIVKYAGTGDGYFVNSVHDVLLGDGAGLNVARVQNDCAQTWHADKLRVYQKRNSRFNAICGSSGAKLARVHYEIRLQEEGAEAQLSNASVLVGDEQSHHFVRIHHEAPHCNSHQNFKSVIDDKGRSSVDGTVIVNEGAQLTSSDQLINNLMLSDTAHADTKPNLMIFADDVKCAHGATVGQIDPDQLFYLKTRGLPEALARELLTTSFVESLIAQIPFAEVVNDLESILLKKLEVSCG